MPATIASRSVSENSGDLPGLTPIATTTLSASASAPGEDIDVAVGHRVESAGIERNSRHSAVLLRLVRSVDRRGFLARSVWSGKAMASPDASRSPQAGMVV